MCKSSKVPIDFVIQMDRKNKMKLGLKIYYGFCTLSQKNMIPEMLIVFF